MIARWLVLFIGIQAFILFYFYDNKKAELESHMQALQSEVDVNYKAFLRQYKKMSEVFYNDIENSPVVLSSIEQYFEGNESNRNFYRDTFIKNVSHEVDLIQKVGFSQVHFHDAEVRSFYRSQMPEKYGDSLADFRYSVANVRLTKEPVFGLEEGRVINGFRYVYPLFYQGKFIGSLGLSVGTQMMQKELNELFLGNYWIILSREIIENITLKDMFEKNYETYSLDDAFLIEKSMAGKKDLKLLSQNLSFQNDGSLHDFHQLYAISPFEEKDYAIIFQPLKNVADQNIGYLVYANEDEVIGEIEKKFYFRVVLFSLFWLVITLFAFYMRRSQIRLMLENSMRKNAEEELRNLNANLENKVQEEMEK